MVNLTSSTAPPFFNSAQLSAATSGASASLEEINPALDLSAEAVQQEADALHGPPDPRLPRGAGAARAPAGAGALPFGGQIC